MAMESKDTQKIEIGHEIIRDKLDWPLVILQHIQGINLMSAKGIDITEAINILEAELSPLLDKDYLDKRSEITTQTNIKLWKLSDQKQQDKWTQYSPESYYYNKQQSIIKEKTKNIFEALVQLIARKNLYFQVSEPQILDDTSEILQRIVRKIKFENQSEVMVITGPTGIGKSERMMYIAEQLSKELKTNFYLIFNADQFMELLQTEPPKGTIICFDEAGAGIASREFWKKEQIKLMKVYQTFRYLQYVTIMTVPHLSFIDKIARLLIHTIIECKSLDRVKNLVMAKIYNRQLSGVKGQEYYDIIPRNGSGKKIDPLYLPRANSTTIEEYEKKKREYLQEFYKDKEEIKKISNRKGICQICGWEPPTIDAVSNEYNISFHQARGKRMSIIKQHSYTHNNVSA